MIRERGRACALVYSLILIFPNNMRLLRMSYTVQPGVRVRGPGVAEVARLQAKEGYAYLKP